MAIAYNPSIVLDSTLVLCLDAANPKSYDARENLLIFSEQADNANWGKAEMTVSANMALSPIGTATADKLVESATSSAYHYRNQGITKAAAATTYTYSLYVKEAGRNAIGLRLDSGGNGAVVTYNISTGATILSPGIYGTFTNASSTITNVGNGWWRISLTATSDTATTMYVQEYLYSTTAGSSVYTGDGTSGVYVWGAQLEQGSVVTPYAVTTATNITRSTAWLDISGSGNHATLYNNPTYTNSGGGSLNFDKVNDYAKCANTNLISNTAYTKIAWFRPEGTSLNIISGGTSSTHAFWMNNTTTTLTSGHDGNWTTVSYSPGSMLNQWWCGAVTFSTSAGHILYLNGAQVSSNAIATTGFSGTKEVRISAFDDASNLFDGDIPVAQVYNRVLTPAEIRQNFNAYRGRYGI